MLVYLPWSYAKELIARAESNHMVSAVKSIRVAGGNLKLSVAKDIYDALVDGRFKMCGTDLERTLPVTIVLDVPDMQLTLRPKEEL